MPVIYFNGSLAITAFTAEHHKDGSWVPAKVLSTDHKYRFRIRVENTAKDPLVFDIGMKILDVLNPAFLFLPQGSSAFVYSQATVSVMGPATLLSAYRFYPDSTFMGTFTPAGTVRATNVLRRGDHEILYLHFKWAGPPATAFSSFPAELAPRVTMNARELKVLELPKGPIATLQPS